MSTTDGLIDRLAIESAPFRRPAPLRFAAMVAGAAVIALALLALALGPPLTALPRIGAAPYVMKISFALSVMLAGATAAWRAAIPGRSTAGAFALLTLPLAAVAVLAMLEAAVVRPAFPGATWLRCLTAIGLLAPPAFIAISLALRRLAPTRLRLSGFVAGIAAGGIAASAYAL
ncbi:MAG: DUF1109 domain-containing protein, partial [Novosphingobium sp.]|nr:DUF1109 domain-containing protein [Novosphingobium sp.]